MTITAKVIADSISKVGKRITTLQLCYPRFIHAEFMTHRVFSRNASSSRAIPVAKMIEQVRTNPAMPIHWGKNQAGMQAREEHNALVYIRNLDGNGWVGSVQEAWVQAARNAADFAEEMAAAGYHKQVVNRILEPFQHIHVVCTATEWDNFFELRAHEDAQPEIHELALQMMIAMDASEPKLLQPGEWHLPYVDEDTWRAVELHLINKWPENASLRTKADVVALLKQVSAARCARVSHLKHDGTNASIEDDLELHNQLVTRPYTDKRGNVLTADDPIHASPIEHQATPDVSLQCPIPGIHEWENPGLQGNFDGWIQNRKVLERDFALK